MSVLDANYPRIETIRVPSDITPEYIGKYVSDFATRFLTELGYANVNRKSVRLAYVGNNGYLWALTFDTSVGYVLPQTLDIGRPHEREYNVLESPSVAYGNQVKASRTKSTGDTK